MKRCLICFSACAKGQSFLDYMLHDDVICGECRRQMKEVKRSFSYQGMSVYAFYLYDEFMESLLFQFKEGKDIALKEVFLYRIKKQIEKQFKGYTIVYMPSHESKSKERTFFALEEMWKGVSLPKVQLFRKNKAYKQSMQSAKNRNKIRHVIERVKGVPIPDTPLLLVDDVCTSGATLLHAYRLLSCHTHVVSACVLCVHELFIEMCEKGGKD